WFSAALTEILIPGSTSQRKCINAISTFSASRSHQCEKALIDATTSISRETSRSGQSWPTEKVQRSDGSNLETARVRCWRRCAVLAPAQKPCGFQIQKWLRSPAERRSRIPGSSHVAQ